MSLKYLSFFGLMHRQIQRYIRFNDQWRYVPKDLEEQDLIQHQRHLIGRFIDEMNDLEKWPSEIIIEISENPKYKYKNPFHSPHTRYFNLTNYWMDVWNKELKALENAPPHYHEPRSKRLRKNLKYLISFLIAFESPAVQSIQQNPNRPGTFDISKKYDLSQTMIPNDYHFHTITKEWKTWDGTYWPQQVKTFLDRWSPIYFNPSDRKYFENPLHQNIKQSHEFYLDSLLEKQPA